MPVFVFYILFTNKTSTGFGWQLKSAQADRKIHPAGAIILTLFSPYVRVEQKMGGKKFRHTRTWSKLDFYFI